MKLMLKLLAAVAVATPTAAFAQSSETDFLQRLEGDWSGSGVVRLKPESEPVNVSCSLDSDASGGAVSMDGACRAMAVFSRQIGAELQADGSSYSGIYIGSKRGPANVVGQRSGDTINLQVDWPGERVANMQVASLGEGRMRLTTVEEHPDTGEQVVTAQIDFRRQ